MQQISVIVVSWNACSYLRDCLNSVRQTAGNSVLEVIVVDNASQDGSPEMVVKEFPEATLLRMTENLGFARANNVGLKSARGDYIALINADVVVHPGCFQELAEFLETHRNGGLVGPKVFGADGRLQRTCRRLPTVWNTLCRTLALDTAFPRLRLFSGREMRNWDQQNLADVEVLSGCFWVAKRQAVEKVGRLDERFFFYAEDVDWCKRFWDAGWKVTFVPTATAIHFGGASSSQAPLRYSVEMLRANLAYWRKHFGKFGQWTYYLLTLAHHALRFALRGLRRIFRKDPGEEADMNFRRSRACLLWLLTGREA